MNSETYQDIDRIDLEQWDRKAQYHLFKDYTDPFFNICVNVDVTGLVREATQKSLSKFLALLHLTTRAVNEIREFRLRLYQDEILNFPIIHPGCTVLNPNKTFRFCYFEYVEDLEEFVRLGVDEINRIPDESLDPRFNALEYIHCSVVPWTSFTAIKHARRDDPGASIPKITLGKFFDQNGRWMMPLSVEANHALMDGYHVGQYFEAIEQFSSAME